MGSLDNTHSGCCFCTQIIGGGGGFCGGYGRENRASYEMEKVKAFLFQKGVDECWCKHCVLLTVPRSGR